MLRGFCDIVIYSNFPPVHVQCAHVQVPLSTNLAPLNWHRALLPPTGAVRRRALSSVRHADGDVERLRDGADPGVQRTRPVGNARRRRQERRRLQRKLPHWWVRDVTRCSWQLASIADIYSWQLLQPAATAGRVTPCLLVVCRDARSSCNCV